MSRRKVTKADLRPQLGTPYPRPVLLCTGHCGQTFNADASDYFYLPDHHIFRCCGRNMRLVVKRVVYAEVMP